MRDSILNLVTEGKKIGESYNQMRISQVPTFVDLKKVCGLSDLSSCKRLLREGTMIKVNKKNLKQERYLYLFDNYLFYGIKSHKFQCKGIIPLNTCICLESMKDSRSAFDVVRLDTYRDYYFIASSDRKSTRLNSSH